VKFTKPKILAVTGLAALAVAGTGTALAATSGPIGNSGLIQIETCNTTALFPPHATGTLNPLCKILPSSNAKAAELDCPRGKIAISASWGGWDGTYGSAGQGLSPLTNGAPLNSPALASPTATDNGYQFIMAPNSMPPMLYVTCVTAV
jgi:hypothetical protein